MIMVGDWDEWTHCFGCWGDVHWAGEVDSAFHLRKCSCTEVVDTGGVCEGTWVRRQGGKCSWGQADHHSQRECQKSKRDGGGHHTVHKLPHICFGLTLSGALSPLLLLIPWGILLAALGLLLKESMACAYVITHLDFYSFSFPHLSDLSGYWGETHCLIHSYTTNEYLDSYLSTDYIWALKLLIKNPVISTVDKSPKCLCP